MSKTCEKIPQASESFDVRLRKAVKSGDLETIRALLGVKSFGLVAIFNSAHRCT